MRDGDGGQLGAAAGAEAYGLRAGTQLNCTGDQATLTNIDADTNAESRLPDNFGATQRGINREWYRGYFDSRGQRRRHTLVSMVPRRQR